MNAPSPVAYDVVWREPSIDETGSMPLGNGEVGVNVWAEAGGAVGLYIARTDAWSENNRLLKVGRVRLLLTPDPFAEAFEQRLSLRTGAVYLTGSHGLTIKLWVDAHADVVRIDGVSDRPLQIEARVEIWRTQPRELTGNERHSAYGQMNLPEPVVVEPDEVIDLGPQRVAWRHRNRRSIWPANLDLQGLSERAAAEADPLLHRTFGAAVVGRQMEQTSRTTMRTTSPRRDFSLDIHTHCDQVEDSETWNAHLADRARLLAEPKRSAAWACHAEWWQAFWARSYIHAGGTPEAEAVSRGYALQRFVTACASRGRFPVKFNGSLFTVAWGVEDMDYDADFRQWGGCYWFQNTRFIYWTMLAADDLEMIDPWLGMYLDALPLARCRTRRYFDHDGAFFPETMTFWATFNADNYGVDRAGKPASFVENTYIRYYWQGGLELLALGLERYAMAPDDQWLVDRLLPLAGAIVEFYGQHYPRDSNGELRVAPASALETWHEAVNPLPEIAGLQHVLDRLLALPESVTSEHRHRWRQLRSELPDLPVGAGEDGRPVLMPAAQFDVLKNMENPELYAVFPYRQFGVGRPNLDLARRTFERRRNRLGCGWCQDGIQAALLGLTDHARRDVIGRFTTPFEHARFPAFWGPNFDWIPDQDHGNTASLALQFMLIQPVGERLHLLPAWPRDWDVEFRLHAPGRTVVEGRLGDGRLEQQLSREGWEVVDHASAAGR